MTINTKENLNDIINKILLVEKEKITDELTRKDIEDWDSMTHLILISELEQNFNIALSDDDIVTIDSIADIKTILTKHGVEFNS